MLATIIVGESIYAIRIEYMTNPPTYNHSFFNLSQTIHIVKWTHHVVSGCGICLSTTTQTAQCVEHTRAHETDEGDQEDLELWRSIPWELQAEE